MSQGLTIVHGKAPLPRVLASGAWLGNAVAASSGTEIRLSPSVGDLDTAENCLAHERVMDGIHQWSDGMPTAIAHDLHPDFYSTVYAQRLAEQWAIPTIGVQHHHAHIAAVCAEHQIEGPVLGVALDGVGLGTDNQPWGGELLLVDGAKFERLSSFEPFPLPGGDKAAREPWRLAATVLHATGRSAEVPKRFADQPGVAVILQMLERDLHCPRTSSAGRVFDAAAGLLGICHVMNEDAEAAKKLEAAATHYIDRSGWPSPLIRGWTLNDAGNLDLMPLLGHLADRQDDTMASAALFHATFVAALAEWINTASNRTGLRRVMLGGGCFYNRLLSRQLRSCLQQWGLQVHMPARIPPGDAGLAVGQAWIAGLRMRG